MFFLTAHLTKQAVSAPFSNYTHPSKTPTQRSPTPTHPHQKISQQVRNKDHKTESMENHIHVQLGLG